MDARDELALPGGAQTDGIVRVGEVRRPLHARSEYVHAVLDHLQATRFDGAPRLLGIDEQGREVLSYIRGEVVIGVPVRLSDARLVSAARLIRRFHDATAGTPLAAIRRSSTTATWARTTSSSTARMRSASSTGTRTSHPGRDSSTSPTPCGAALTCARTASTCATAAAIFAAMTAWMAGHGPALKAAL